MELRNDYKIYWKENKIAKIKKGKNYLTPEIEVLADDALDLQTKVEFTKFLNKWLEKHISEELKDLTNLTALNSKNNYLRAIAFQL